MHDSDTKNSVQQNFTDIGRTNQGRADNQESERRDVSIQKTNRKCDANMMKTTQMLMSQDVTCAESECE